MSATSYAIAIGSNRRGRHGGPERAVAAAIAALPALGDVRAAASVHRTAPLGAARRRFANSAVLLDTRLDPPALLAALKAVEARFGRRGGRRWGDRVIDLDIILWSGGRWRSPALSVPHPAWRTRAFVLAPLCEIAAGWRDPVTRRTVRQLAHAVDRPRLRS